MPYSYDRRHYVLASEAGQILSLIIRKALADRNVESLVRAYLDELEEEWEANHDLDDGPPADEREHAKWQTRVFGLLHTEADVERAMADAFVATYRHLVQHPVSREEALGVFLFPHPGFPEKNVPKAVAVAVAQAIARRDAAEANHMRDLARARH